MIDYLIFIEELKALMTENVSNTYVEDINKLIRKYEKKVSDFESDMAPKEEVDVLKMSSGSSFMQNYQNANMRDYDDTKKYSEKDL